MEQVIFFSGILFGQTIGILFGPKIYQMVKSKIAVQKALNTAVSYNMVTFWLLVAKRSVVPFSYPLC